MTGRDMPLSGVLAVTETDEKGRLTKNSQELLGAAQLLKRLTGEELMTAVIGMQTEAAISSLCMYPASSVIDCMAQTGDGHDLDAYTGALVYLAEKYRPRYLLLPMSVTGREAGPRAAAILDAGIMADCMAIGRGQTGEAVFTRLSFGGYLSADISFSGRGMQVVTIRPGMFDKAEPSGAGCPLIHEQVPEGGLAGLTGRSLFISQIRNTAQGILAVEDADVIVAGGRGAGGEKGFALIRELASLLGGAVGASRVAVDKGWIGHEALIGQSGKTVAPALYITCGIAGSIQHITGMRDSGCVVSINTDPRALIYDVSDYGIVGDLFTVLPVLIEEIRKIR